MAQADREAFMLFGNIFQKWKEHLFSNLVPLFYRPAEIAQEDLHAGCPKKQIAAGAQNRNKTSMWWSQISLGHDLRAIDPALPYRSKKRQFFFQKWANQIAVERGVSYW